MATADVTVMGAGIFGLSIAWDCVRRGARVAIIDPNGAASGSSGGLVGALAPHVPENWNSKKAFQLDSLLRAQKFWSEVEGCSGLSSGYVRSGRIQPIHDARGLDLARQRVLSAENLWGQHATWTVEASQERDWPPPSPTGYYIKDTLSALLHPRQACQALVAALEAKGVVVQSEGPEIGAVVWATGVAGLMDLNRTHHRSIGNGVKGQAALLGFDARGAPQLFANGLHIIPHLDGTVGIGSTSEREYTSPDATDTQLEDLVAQARAAVPALRTAPIAGRWAGVRPRTRSRAPMLGAWPGRPGHFIANGGFKIGFGMAPKAAEVMAELILEGRDAIPAGFSIEASF